MLTKIKEKIVDVCSVSYAVLRNRLSISDGSGSIAEFEKNLNSFFGTKFALACMNGTAALHSAYFALNLKEGDEVIVPSYTWHATVMPLLNLKLKPVFADIDENTLTINPVDVEKKITVKTKAIIVVHLFGFVADMNSLKTVCKKHKLLLIEDISHAVGATYNTQKVGSIGDIACGSLQQSKALAAGEGGFLLTSNREMYERSLLFGHPGRLVKEITLAKYKPYTYTGLGLKLRPHPLGIILANNKLKAIKTQNEANKKVFFNMQSILKNCPGIKTIEVNKNSSLGSIYRYHFRYLRKDKGAFLSILNKKNVPVHNEEYHLLHAEPIFKEQDGAKTNLPISEKVHAEMVWLPFPDKNILRYGKIIQETCLQKK